MKNDEFQENLSRPGIIDARARYRAAARPLWNTELGAIVSWGDKTYFLAQMNFEVQTYRFRKQVETFLSQVNICVLFSVECIILQDCDYLLLCPRLVTNSHSIVVLT